MLLADFFSLKKIFVDCYMSAYLCRSEDEQNLVAYQYKGKIYYRAYKEIKEGMELLVWYGGQYAEQLRIAKQKLVRTCHRFSFSGMFFVLLRACNNL